MGGSVGVGKIETESVAAFFVDARLLAGEKLMKMNRFARAEFVEYIKAGTWSDNLSHFEDFLNTRSSCDDSTWAKFGYKSPYLSLSRSTRTGSCSGSFSSELYAAEFESMAGSIHHKLMLEECYNAISNSHLFLVEELRAVLIAALLPIYLCSGEYLQSKESSDWIVGFDVEDVCALEYIPEKSEGNQKRSERLQEWLLGAAAMFDGSQLEAYLADPCGSWVEDYKRALYNLPLTFYLSTVDRAKKESKVVFCNAMKKSLLFGDKSLVGANLHEVFSERSPPHVAEQIETAVFAGRKYKRTALGEYDSCLLRALKPVRNALGDYVYTLGIESYPFVDPLQEESVVKEQPFQQVEDLLALLPMLLKLPCETKG
jgi:hypothetical protein